MNKSILSLLQEVYPDSIDEIMNHLSAYEVLSRPHGWVDESTSFLITYGDTIQSSTFVPLEALRQFASKHLKNNMSALHILPMFPYTSDDGFSVVDYYSINPLLGTWDDIRSLAKDFDLMFDAVVNHISQASEWFQKALMGEQKYQDFFVECDLSNDYSKVVRPRALPLYYPYETAQGIKHYWATFSKDQVDLNFKNKSVFLAILDVLYTYAKQGATYIRLDAVGFLWKELGTTCLHLPNTHRIIQLYREILDVIAPGTILITETNVPHMENISYFGGDKKEAHMVYQFSLPPLLLYSYIHQNTEVLMEWISSIAATPLHDNQSFFNFLSSHDGIGMRPTESILDKDQQQSMVDHVLSIGGQLGLRANPDGSQSVYELNTTFFDAIRLPEDSDHEHQMKMISSHAILLAMNGVPAIYIHSLLGSHNDVQSAIDSGIPRRINRSKLSLEELDRELEGARNERTIIFQGILKLLMIRRAYPAFHPDGLMEVLPRGPYIVGIRRQHLGSHIETFVNVSCDIQHVHCSPGQNLLTEEAVGDVLRLEPYGVGWILCQSSR